MKRAPGSSFEPITEFVPDSPLEEAVRSEPVSKMGFSEITRDSEGFIAPLPGGKGGRFRRMGGVSLNSAASRSFRFWF
jgi:hypothetical protein